MELLRKSIYKNSTLHIVLLVLVASFMLFPNITDSPVYSWDEARHGVNALEMIDSGDWITLQYNNQPDSANLKFPLGAWLTAINFKLFGVNEFSLRLWSVIFTILTAVLVYLLGSLIKNRRLGMLSSLVFITSMQVMTRHGGITGDYDAGAGFFIALSLLLFLFSYKSKRGNFFLLSMGAVGFAVMYKSLLSGLIPLLIIFIFLLFSKDRKIFLNLRTLLLSAVIIIAITFPWLIARSASDSSFFFKLLSLDYWARFTGSVDEHGEPFWFYITQMKNSFFPWVYFLLLGLLVMFRDYQRNRKENGGRGSLFILIWFFTIFLSLSAATTKNYWYMLPVFPAMAIAVAALWLFLFEEISKLKIKKVFSVVLTAVLAAFLILNLALAFFNVKSYLVITKNRSQFSAFITSESVKNELTHDTKTIVSSKMNLQSNFFYLKRLLNNNFVFSSVMPCALRDDERIMIKTDDLKQYLETCPERKLIVHYADYALVR